MTVDIIPFTEDMLAEAGTLLAQRHRRDRLSLPELPVRFEDPAVAVAAVQAGLGREHAAGLAAVGGDRLLGYLIGDLVIDAVWGRSAWVRLAGCALAPGQSPELVRDLYAALARDWVTWGCFTHFALVPTADPALLQRLARPQLWHRAGARPGGAAAARPEPAALAARRGNPPVHPRRPGGAGSNVRPDLARQCGGAGVGAAPARRRRRAAPRLWRPG